MKITKAQLKQIIKEEVGRMQGTLAEVDPRLARIRNQRETVGDLAAVTSLASLGDTPATGRPEIVNRVAPAGEDTINAFLDSQESRGASYHDVAAWVKFTDSYGGTGKHSTGDVREWGVAFGLDDDAIYDEIYGYNS